MKTYRSFFSLDLLAVSEVAPLFIYFNPTAAAPELSVHLRSHDPFPIDMEQAATNPVSVREQTAREPGSYSFNQSSRSLYSFLTVT